ncbi:MAG: hypothetical protein ACYCPP_06595 [Nitrososphaerales archaeon]
MAIEESISSLALKASDVLTFCKIAKANGTILSLKDVILLASLDMTEDELIRAWDECDELNSGYQIVSARIVERNARQDDVHYEIMGEYTERLLRATSNVAFAKTFASFLQDKNLKLICISGSTSYLSVSREDDLDFFLVTKRNSMWTTFAKSLLLARLFRISQHSSPSLCLSYIADEDFITSQFRKPQDALFARDAISATVVRGEGFFSNLLYLGSWMTRYFPKMYNSRLKGRKKETPVDYDTSSSVERILDLFVFYIVGRYIRVKSNLLNRKLSKLGLRDSVFKVKMGKDHCIYESFSYMELKRMYSELQKKSGATILR